MLRDLGLLGIDSVAQLAEQRPGALYERLCALTHSRQDPCVLDTFTCAIAQAQDPDLPAEQRQWWYWSRLRLAGARSRPQVTARARRAT